MKPPFFSRTNLITADLFFRDELFFQRRDFLWGYAVFGFCTFGARDQKSGPGKLTPMVLILNQMHTT